MAGRRVEAPTIRCAVYTRKSTEEGLEQEFNSLDAQREAGESFIASQKSEGWVCLPDRYDDGGFTGGNMERPALKRLMADIDAGRVDCVVVYKVDRLSRSLLDFTQIMEALEKRGVSFVSVTQQFNTTSSMGRLTLNILLSFAQFEREIISERTRDKIAAARRKGKWSGGRPILGYDVAPGGGRLVVNEEEAARVRATYEVYLDRQSLIETIKELDARGWTNKRWITKKGRESGGAPFNKHSLYSLLTNVLYIGRLTYKDEVHDGEHPAIVDEDMFRRAGQILKRNGATGGRHVRNRFGAILKGLINCVPCNCAMVPTHATKKDRRYRYYVCVNAQKRGWHTCPSKSIPAGEIEKFVIDQVRGIGRDPSLLVETLGGARAEAKERMKELEAEKAGLERELKRHNAQMRELAGAAGSGGTATDRMADLLDRIRGAEQRLAQVRDELARLERGMIDENEAAKALAAFDPVWETLTLREQARVLNLLIQRVDYDGDKGTVSVTFHPAGIETLSREYAEENA
ncbi:MAG TPA: recombinase family protein [Candidatus Nanopelagicales bacterium]|nr:recombinase family protein [Candidatus Krumholzibacteria bacterium]HRV67128.1 recombinase family protein [Candidatus Nanopelagicales bacterium]